MYIVVGASTFCVSFTAYGSTVFFTLNVSSTIGTWYQ